MTYNGGDGGDGLVAISYNERPALDVYDPTVDQPVTPAQTPEVADGNQVASPTIGGIEIARFGTSWEIRVAVNNKASGTVAQEVLLRYLAERKYAAWVMATQGGSIYYLSVPNGEPRYVEAVARTTKNSGADQSPYSPISKAMAAQSAVGTGVPVISMVYTPEDTNLGIADYITWSVTAPNWINVAQVIVTGVSAGGPARPGSSWSGTINNPTAGTWTITARAIATNGSSSATVSQSVVAS